MQGQLHVHVSRVKKLNLVSDGNFLIYLPMHVILLHLICKQNYIHVCIALSVSYHELHFYEKYW